jgi:hypothetical protein
MKYLVNVIIVQIKPFNVTKKGLKKVYGVVKEHNLDITIL